MQWVANYQQQIGGPGIIVEIDEAKLGKKKYNKGRVLRGQWIFGGIERDSGKLFILPISDRSTDTLIPLTTRYIKPGSIIHTDCWKAYSKFICIINISVLTTKKILLIPLQAFTHKT